MPQSSGNDQSAYPIPQPRSESISERFRTNLTGKSSGRTLIEGYPMSNEDQLNEEPFSMYFGHVDEVPATGLMRVPPLLRFPQSLKVRSDLQP